MVRYADDFVVFCETRDGAEVVIGIPQDWLAQRGLHLAEEKTRIVRLTEGFDFLGFTIRHDKDRRTGTGENLLITPSAASGMRIKQVRRDEWFRLQGTNVQAILHALNPIVRGWANDFRIAVASQTFDRLNDWMFQRAVRYAHRTHPHQPWYWKKARSWGRLNTMRNDHWGFGDKHTGGYLLKFGWHRIHRHPLVRGTASPDDPALTDYWAKRQTRIGATEPASSHRASAGWRVFSTTSARCVGNRSRMVRRSTSIIAKGDKREMAGRT